MLKSRFICVIENIKFHHDNKNINRITHQLQIIILYLNDINDVLVTFKKRDVVTKNQITDLLNIQLYIYQSFITLCSTQISMLHILIIFTPSVVKVVMLDLVMKTAIAQVFVVYIVEVTVLVLTVVIVDV